MIRYGLLADFASNLRGGNYLLEIAPLRILQCLLQFAGKPKFIAVFIEMAKVVKQFFLLYFKFVHTKIIA